MNPYPRNNRHNHLTRDIKPLGECPSCDEYHNRNIPKKELIEMKKHYVGAVYDLTKENMNNLIKQLEEKGSKVSFEYANTHDNKWEIECHIKAVDSQVAICDAINEIRSRLKYMKTSKAEREFLEMLRRDLSEAWIEG